MAVADKDNSFIISGNGDVLEPEHGIIAIGSGGNYALAAARAMIDSEKSAEEIAKKSIEIAADICVFTNHNITTEKL
jgi:ATP-dependent HslUV protease subunit HslV